MILVFTKFVICSLLIIFAGIKVAKYGDIIAEKTILGRALVGLLLLALVTSLPEVFCGISAVAIVGIPDLTLGDIFGSCIFNLLILGILDVLNKKEPFLYHASQSHIMSAGCFASLMGVVLVSILLSQQIGMITIGWIGVYTLIIVVLYFLMVRGIFQFEKNQKPPSEEEQYGAASLKATLWKFGIASAIVIGAAMWLPKIGEEIAVMTGLANTFVGTLFMAIADILGSNLFDLLIIAIDDVFYLKGSFLSDVNPAHILTGIIAIMMTGMVIVGLTSNSSRKTFRVINWDALAIIGLFLTGVFFLYCLLGGG
jgi:cation:H+ antiporter